ncbi:MAG: hypothetical protein Q7Q71_08950 [Verrucomicrobiota bacterium JB023]|nr:hypothetical protein [Verrucomicrobiota bacterium JB023]
MVSKHLVGWAETVAVDESEVIALPGEVRDALREVGGITPKVILMNPGLTANYGGFSHQEMTGKNWSIIFREARGAISQAKREGSFLDSASLVKVEDSQIEKWTSAAGSVIEAKLVAVDGEVFVFETSAGKTIRAAADKLSEESVQRARSLAEESK